MNAGPERALALFVSAGKRNCCVPLAHVIETMRPHPIEGVAGMPPFVKGLSVIRGAPVPVVDLAALVGAHETPGVSRLVSLRLGDRRVALAVERVVGVRELDTASLGQMPPLLGAASAETVEAIGALDAQLLLVLRATRILTETMWQALDVRDATA